MSNQRRPSLFHLYTEGYLRSPAWFARRARWFTEQQRTDAPLGCAACGKPAAKSELELHHLDYTSVHIGSGRYRAGEAHEDLMPMHPVCHELLHRLIDRDEVLSRHRTRRDATHLAIERLRPRLQSLEEAS